MAKDGCFVQKCFIKVLGNKTIQSPTWKQVGLCLVLTKIVKKKGNRYKVSYLISIWGDEYVL